MPSSAWFCWSLSRWRWRSLLSSRSRLDRLRVHGGLLWSSAKKCARRYEVAACGRVHWIYFGNFTTNARCALHEPHSLDSLVVLDGGLDKPPDFLLAEPEKKSGLCIMKCRLQCLTFSTRKASTYSALEIFSMLVPPGAPIGSPHVMA